MGKYVILLTACINPDGMSFTKLTNPDERKRQYADALLYYLTHTSLPIVFAENSNTDISHLFTDQFSGGRLEILTFQGNKNKTKGKGYGEAEIIEYAMNHSQMIDNTSCIIKITGRLIVENIQSIIDERSLLKLNQSVQCTILSKFSYADSRLMIVPVAFMKCFLARKSQIDDSKKMIFEEVLLDTIKEVKAYYYFPFTKEPQIVGMSGTTGEVYQQSPQHSFKDRMLYLKYQLWIVIHYPEYSLQRLSWPKFFGIQILYMLMSFFYYVYRIRIGFNRNNKLDHE
jgi:hypothetical protein